MIVYSVVICVHNEEDKIAETLNNILSYGRLDVEVIVIDDSSTDNTLKIVQGIETVKAVPFHTNKGISVARNTGAKLAQGKYIVFLDGHVILKNDIFAVYDRYFKRYPEINGISGTYHSLLQEDFNSVRDVVRSLYRKKDVDSFLITNDNFTTLSSCVLCIEKELILKNPFIDDFRGVAAEDTFVQLLLMEKKYKFMHVKEVSIIHHASLSYLGLLKKIVYQCRGTHRLLAKILKENIVAIPFSSYYLDFPLFLFILFYLSLFFGFNPYLFLGAFLLDFWKLGKLFLARRMNIKLKVQTAFYIILNESIKIIDWPLSIFRERYRFKDIFRAVKIFFCWQKNKFNYHR